MLVHAACPTVRHNPAPGHTVSSVHVTCHVPHTALCACVNQILLSLCGVAEDKGVRTCARPGPPPSRLTSITCQHLLASWPHKHNRTSLSSTSHDQDEMSVSHSLAQS